MGKGFRQGRLAEEIRRIISDLLLRELKDPGIEGMVTVSAVEVTRDGSYATVYLTSFDLNSGSEEEKEVKKEKLIAAMKRAKGVMKKEIGRQVKLRHIPELIFKIDTSLEYGLHIEGLIGEISKNERKDEE